MPISSCSKRIIVLVGTIVFVWGSWFVKGDAQYDALIDFFNSTGGPNWVNSTGWGTNDDPCGRKSGNSAWFGLKCSGGWVIKISLPKNGLGGLLPPSIVNITYLETIDVTYNMLIGTIPATLTEASSLTWISLANNHFKGEIPNFGDNNTSGIEALYLGNNQLQGAIPQSFLNIKSLTELDLSWNHLTGEVPSGLGDLSLQSLWIDNNDFSGTMPLSLCQSLILCSAAFNPQLMCASMSCTCGAMQSCNCNTMCETDANCAGGMCTSCQGASHYFNGYCQ